MPNILLSTRTAQEIDQQVAKILDDLDISTPPINLDDVRELLKLDRRYYTATDTGMVEEVIHRLRIGAQQVLAKPTRILDAIRQKSLRALWVPDRRRILIDSELPPIKQRWGEAHEVIHSVIPHHAILTLGDPLHTLAVGCHEQIEAEANYGAGRLLFLGELFRERLLASPVTFASVHDLAGAFSNSKTSTLWRIVETLDIPAVGLISAHPWAKEVDGQSRVRHFVRSGRFAGQFAGVSEEAIYRALGKVVHRPGCGPIGAKEAVLKDADGTDHVFFFECFAHKHDTLTLGLHRGPRIALVGVGA